MARHVFVGLLVIACLLQIALSVPPRERRDVDSTTAEPTSLQKVIERLVEDLKKKTQQPFSEDFVRSLQANITKFFENSGAINNLLDSARNLASTSSPAAGEAAAK